MLRYKEIKNELLQEISSLSPGDKLLSRPKLCKKLDTTRATLDKAIKELEAEGYLSSKDGSGTYLVELFDKSPHIATNWGIIVPDIMYSIYSGLVRGAENIAQQHDINIIICNSDNQPSKQEQYIKRLLLSGVSGIILVPVIPNNIRENFHLYNQLADIKTPFVFCNRSVEGINVPVITSNDFYGGYAATKHLIGLGYQNIAYIASKKYVTSTERCKGYLSALIEAGIEVNRRHIVFLDHEDLNEAGYEALIKIQDMGMPLDAAFCFNDKIASGCYRALHGKNVKISDDFGIISYDNSDICLKLEPKLTSVSYKNVEIGTKAAEILWKITTKQYIPDFEYYLLHPDIVIRESCLGKNRTKGKL